MFRRRWAFDSFHARLHRSRRGPVVPGGDNVASEGRAGWRFPAGYGVEALRLLARLGSPASYCPNRGSIPRLAQHAYRLGQHLDNFTVNPPRHLPSPHTPRWRPSGGIGQAPYGRFDALQHVQLDFLLENGKVIPLIIDINVAVRQDHLGLIVAG